MTFYGIFMILYCITLPLITLAMNNTSRKTKDHAVQWIDHNTIAIASTHGCHLAFNVHSKTPDIKKVHYIPTYNLIYNRTKKILGCMCEQQFIVYDIEKIRQVWHQHTHGNQYSAAFGPNNSIFLCVQQKLFSNQSKPAPTLPYTGKHKDINIACHPTTKKIAYPLHNTALAIRSMESIDFTTHTFEKLKGDAIQHLIYSHDGDHIALLTDDHNVLIHDVANKETKKIGRYHSATFFDDSIIALIDNQTSVIDFWNYKTQQLVAWKYVLPEQFPCSNAVTNILDFSPDQLYFSTIIENKCTIFPVPFALTKKKFIFMYWLMRQHLCDPEKPIFPPEVIRLIMLPIVNPWLS